MEKKPNRANLPDHLSANPWQGTAGRGPHLEIDESVGPKAFHGEELQVPLEVLGIEAGNGKPIPKAGLQGAGRKCVEEAGAAATDVLSEQC